MFQGIVPMRDKPGALIVIDSKKEDTSVREARQLNIPIVALSGSDCDISLVDYPVPASDTNRKSIVFFLEEIAGAYESGKTLKTEAQEAQAEEK